MISREEVAKNLREAGERLDEKAPRDLTAAAYTTLFELLESAGIREGNSYSDVFSRLADIIDPTCHMSCEYGSGDKVTEEYMEEIAGTHEDTVACHCHSCDALFRYDRGIIPNYCPHCGSRVVRDA